MDDLIVNENPNSHYVKEDAERTPEIRKCFAALRDGDVVMPRGVKTVKVWNHAQKASSSTPNPRPPPAPSPWPQVWEDAQKAAKEAERLVNGKDYRIVEQGGVRQAVILVDGVIPKVPRTALWQTYLNYKISKMDPMSESPWATVSTPYIFNKYARLTLHAPPGPGPNFACMQVRGHIRPLGLGRRAGGDGLPHRHLRRRQVRGAAVPRHVHRHAAEAGESSHGIGP